MNIDSNGMPVLQPTVDDSSTATFNAAFAAIGTEVNRRRFFTGTASARATWVTSGKAIAGDTWQDTNGDRFGYVYSGSGWEGVIGDVAGSISFAALTASPGVFLRRYANGIVEGYYNAVYDDPIADGSNIGSLPVDFRPSGTTYFPAAMAIGGSAASCMVTVGSNGSITVYGIGGSGNKQVAFPFSFRKA